MSAQALADVVALRGAAKRYSRAGRWVLRDVDVAVAPGMTIDVRGPNGAGKSTLLRLLAGATVPTRGRRVAQRRLAIGYAPERLAPAPPFSGFAYLRHHARLRGLAPRDGEAQTAQLAERLGLGELLAERLAALSKGTLQKVVLVQALLGSPRLLVLDEPFSGLDAAAQRELAALVAERAAAGSAVLFADHRAGEARPSADVAWQLVDGGVRETNGGHAAAARRRVTANAARSDAVLADLLADGWHIVSVTAGDPVEIVATREPSP
jgi:ABC-type multidrug transport system ATPase subunit